MKKKMTSMKSILGPAKAKPAAKAAPKKKAAKPAMGMPEPVMHREPKTVRITAAENGMTVSSYGPKGEELRVAKSTAEALRHCKDMLK